MPQNVDEGFMCDQVLAAWIGRMDLKRNHGVLVEVDIENDTKLATIRRSEDGAGAIKMVSTHAFCKNMCLEVIKN